MNITREYFSIKELAEYAGISVRKLRDLLGTSPNPIPAYRFGGSIKVKRSEFDDWAKSCRIDNDRIDRLVNEAMRDLEVRKAKQGRKSGSKVNAKNGANKKN
jgi:excisionase family DNA binding protein